jgi:hypothetical protein
VVVSTLDVSEGPGLRLLLDPRSSNSPLRLEALSATFVDWARPLLSLSRAPSPLGTFSVVRAKGFVWPFAVTAGPPNGFVVGAGLGAKGLWGCEEAVGLGVPKLLRAEAPDVPIVFFDSDAKGFAGLARRSNGELARGGWSLFFANADGAPKLDACPEGWPKDEAACDDASNGEADREFGCSVGADREGAPNAEGCPKVDILCDLPPSCRCCLFRC